MDNFPAHELQQTADDACLAEAVLNSTQLETYRLFQEMDNPAAVAAARGLKTSTIITHLSEAIKAGLPVKIESLGLRDSTRKIIENTISSEEINCHVFRLGPIKAKCEREVSKEITWDDIKIVVALLIREHGLKDDRLCWDLSGAAPPPPPPDKKKLTTPPASVASHPNSGATFSPEISSVSFSKETNGKRELPDWMKSSSAKDVMKKKMKKNNLFK